MRRPRTPSVVPFLVLVVALAGALALGLPAPVVAGSYLILVPAGAGGALPDAVADAGGRLSRYHPEIGVAAALSDDPGFVAAMAEGGFQQVAPDPVILWVPDIDATAVVIEGSAAGPPLSTASPEDATLYACQWNLRQVDAPGAWAAGAFGDPDVEVAVVDSGVDPFHVDLAGRVDTARSTSVLSSSPCGAADTGTFYDLSNHGTFVASQITTNGLGIAAVAPAARVVAVKALSCQGSGTFADVIDGILYAAGLDGVEVINLSLGALVPRNLGTGTLLGALARAVNHARAEGKLVIAAAGSSGLDLQHAQDWIYVPAESGTALGIYDTTIEDLLASSSNYGLSAAPLGAPGGSFPNPGPPLPGCPVAPQSQSLVLGACSSFVCSGTGQYLLATGTAIASGVAALVDGQAAGALTPGQLEQILLQTADDLGRQGVDPVYGHGRVNAARAVGAIE